MHLPERSRSSWLTRPRLVGTPAHWAAQGAVLGGLVAWLTPFFLGMLVAWSTSWPLSLALLALFNPVLVAGGAVGAAAGAAVGLAQPALLDRVRGRVPIPVVALAQGWIGAAAGAAVAGLEPVLGQIIVRGSVADWEVVPVAAAVGAVVGAVSALVAWLPITVGTVLRRRVTPLTGVLGAGIPAGITLALAALVAL